MSATAALLAQYESVKSQITFYTLEQVKWEGLHERMAANVEKMTKYQEDWDEGYEKYENAYNDNKKDFTAKGMNWLKYTESNYDKNDADKGKNYKGHYLDQKGQKKTFNRTQLTAFPGWSSIIGDYDQIAKACADRICPQWANDGQRKLEEYADLDMQYDAYLTTCETMLQELRAQEESLKTAVGDGAKDTNMDGAS